MARYFDISSSFLPNYRMPPPQNRQSKLKSSTTVLFSAPPLIYPISSYPPSIGFDIFMLASLDRIWSFFLIFPSHFNQYNLCLCHKKTNSASFKIDYTGQIFFL